MLTTLSVPDHSQASEAKRSALFAEAYLSRKMLCHPTQLLRVGHHETDYSNSLL